MPLIRNISEQVARKTSRRGFFGSGANVLFGALAGAAAGTITRDGRNAIAGTNCGGTTCCAFPGPPCHCDKCLSNGVCAKPCIILTTYYASGCWVASSNGATCCDCDCEGIGGVQNCGCGTDYHNDLANCPNGTG